MIGLLMCLKKHKNVIYKLMPLGILFPASIKNKYLSQVEN